MSEDIDKLIKDLDDEHAFGRHYVAKALGKIGDARAVEPLCGALGDVRNYLTHEYAAEALAKIGDPRAVEPLCKVLGNKDIDDRRQAGRPFAAEALGKIGDARAVETLCEALGDRNGHKRWDGYGPDYTAQTRKKAAQALGK